MTTIVGGLRNRLIRDSVYTMLNDALEDLGWFDSGRQHAALTFTPKAVYETGIELNTLSLTYDALTDDDIEIGSNYKEERWTFYLDFYAESDAVGLDLASDMRDVLRGKMPSIGRGSPHLVVYDWRLATPPELFRVEIEDVVMDVARNGAKPWQKYWYVVRFDILDCYGDEEDDS